MDELKAVGVMIISVIGFFFLLFWAIIAINYNVQNVHLKVFVEEKMVYDGRSACVDVASAGYATTVNIGGGWYCIFPKEHYTEKDVRVETVK